MSDFFLMIWLLMIAMTTLVSSFQHHSRISSCCSSHIIKEHSYRYIKNRYNYGQEQNYHIIGDVRFIALSTSALCNTVKEALMNDPDFEVFSRLLKQANLEDVESSIGKFKHITVIPSSLSLLFCVNYIALDCNLCQQSHIN